MTRKNTQNPRLIHIDSGAGLSNATIQLRLTVLRLFYDHLVVEGLRPNNPVGRSYLSKRRGAEVRQGPLFRRHRKLPWIPSEEQWEAILKTIKREPLRNRFMFALSYDAALRRQDLLNVETNDIDPAHRLLRVRGDKTKNGLSGLYRTPRRPDSSTRPTSSIDANSVRIAGLCSCRSQTGTIASRFRSGRGPKWQSILRLPLEFIASPHTRFAICPNRLGTGRLGHS